MSASDRVRPRTRSAFSSAAAVFLRFAMLPQDTGGGRCFLARGAAGVHADCFTTVTHPACSGGASGSSSVHAP